MKIQGRPYEVSILGANAQSVTETKEGYAPLAHGEHYKVKVRNDSSERCSAEITIDGQVMGDFIVLAWGEIEIDRPASIAKLFTFYAKGSEEAGQALLQQVSADDLGLVSVKIAPEKPRQRVYPSISQYSPWEWGNNLKGGGTMGDDAMRGGGTTSGGRVRRGGRSSKGMGAGGTGLSGDSSQRFTSVSFNADESRAVTLNIRLAHDSKRGQESDIQPLPGRLPKSTPVPKPL